MTRRSNGNSLRPAQQQAFARSPSAKFEGEALRFFHGLDCLEAPAQIRGDEAAMAHRMVTNDSSRLGGRSDRMTVMQVYGGTYCECGHRSAP
jgi:hypothetical protein